jgi:heat shock protein HspQ
MTQTRSARFALGQIVRQRDEAFIGVILDVDPRYDGPAIETGPFRADQPFYRVLTAGPEGGFIVYAAEEALEGHPVGGLSPDEEARWFTADAAGRHAPRD